MQANKPPPTRQPTARPAPRRKDFHGLRRRPADTEEFGPDIDLQRLFVRQAAVVAGVGEVVVIRDPEWGGLVVADVMEDGCWLALALIVAGHGRAYDGGKREGWYD